jgi:hypothetical protein
MNGISGKVVKCIDDYNVIINLGSRDGVTEKDLYLIYNLGEEIFDSETHESLGILEIVCGEGKPTHIQEKMTTLTSSKNEVRSTKIVRRNNNLMFGGVTEETYDPEKTQIPFEGVIVNSLVKKIN